MVSLQEGSITYGIILIHVYCIYMYCSMRWPAYVLGLLRHNYVEPMHNITRWYNLVDLLISVWTGYPSVIDHPHVRLAKYAYSMIRPMLKCSAPALRCRIPGGFCRRKLLQNTAEHRLTNWRNTPGRPGCCFAYFPQSVFSKAILFTSN
jgi:hypothetical protein